MKSRVIAIILTDVTSLEPRVRQKALCLKRTLMYRAME